MNALWQLLKGLSSSHRSVYSCSMRMSKSRKRGNEEEGGNPTKKATGHWADGLLAAMNDPNLRVCADNQVIVIKDKYPKAQFHFLVMPRESIPSLTVLDKSHLTLLQHMHQVGCRIAEQKEHKSKTFKMGYHAEPSMHHLHMHLISDDFCSDSLKTKKHYNSFTTDHFIDSQRLIESVQSTGKIITLSPAESQKLLQQPLVCHKCGENMANMPKLKKHLNDHTCSP